MLYKLCKIQTLYLIISIIIDIVSLYILYPVEKKYFFSLQSNIFFISLCLLLSISYFFFFHKKKIQILLNKINILVNISISIIKVFYFFYDDKYFHNILIKKKWIFLLILFIFNSIVLNIANKSIKTDLKIIDSMNRIR
ncbi:DUF4293 family protein [Blattabacterium cuenoti]|uniref:DUF4293 family protein n=1 Tax=Blattabacterium cuenoti TaxID=1653831 RepID=UPI00163B66BD|nr:DUF4293 family protein [Blattabacterium cuenoti]